MCRFNLITDSTVWQRQFGVALDGVPLAAQQPHYNLCRDDAVQVIRRENGRRVLGLMRWGFVPHWVQSKNPRVQPLTVHDNSLTKPHFREAFQERRCLVPMSGYYGWEGWENGPGLPYHIRMRDHRAFLVAGIWDRWQGVERVAIITTSANALVQPIYERMPVIIEPQDAQLWLAGGDVAPLLRPYPAEAMEAYRVSRALFTKGSEGPGLIEPAPAQEVLRKIAS